MKTANPPKPRLREVAKYAKVSIGAASRALADHPNISGETKRRVREASRQLGYQPKSPKAPRVAGAAARIGFVALGTPLANDSNSPLLYHLSRVTMVQGRKGPTDRDRPQLKMGLVEIKVSAEQRRLALENMILENNVLSERIRMAKELGATDRDLAPLLNELVFKPLTALDRYQDKGVIGPAEIPHDPERDQDT